MSTDAHLAEARQALLQVMSQMERGLGKARKGLVADRPLPDLAPMFEGLRTQFEAMVGAGAAYERHWVARDEHQRNFMQQKGSYLDGLHSHVLGGADMPSEGSRANKIFRRAAYVADNAFRATPMRTVL